MTQYLRQSTAATLKLGPFIDDTGAVTAGLTISQADVRLSKNGANIAQKNEATACTYDEVGMYDCPVDATDTDTLGRLDVIVAETGAMIVVQGFNVIPATVYDTLFAASFPRGPVLASGTLGATGNSTTALHLTGLAYADDDINGNLIVICDVSTGLVHSTYISDWANTGDLATVPTLPFTPQASVDTYVILAIRKEVNVTHWLGTAVATPTVAGVPEVDLTHWLGTAAATPTVAGVPEVDLTHVGGSTTNVAALATNADAIKASTDLLPSDPADASVVAGLIAAAEAKVDTLLTRLSAVRAGYLDYLNGTVAGLIKKNTAFTNFMIKMELTDGSPGTGLTVTVQRAIDGGAFAALAVTTVTEISDGWYKFNLAAADVNGNAIAIKATATGAKQLDLLIVTQVAG